jgi:hypothetical protein
MEPLNSCLKACSAYIQNNYVRFFRIVKTRLPLLCHLALFRKLPEIELAMIRQYNITFSAKNVNKYPIDHFLNITLLNDNKSIDKFIKNNLVQIDGESNICFSKGNCNNNPKVFESN